MNRRDLLVQSLALLWLSSCGGHPEAPSVVPNSVDSDSVFQRVYSSPELRTRFKNFLLNVFHLYPEDAFHGLIAEAAAAGETDESIYRLIEAGLPKITPMGATVRYALPALKKQKRIMAEQAVALLGDSTRFDGYVEMGTTGRYLRTLEDRVQIEGPVFVLNDVAPTNSPVDMVERGQLRKVGSFVHLADYAPLSTDIPDATIDLVSNLIGFHHAPVDALDPFVESLRRVLRPGGRLLLREHDVRNPELDSLVTLAHDVFNVGVGLTWEENASQLRAFRSIEDWVRFLEARGFRREAGSQLQSGDPTDNTLLAFRRV